MRVEFARRHDHRVEAQCGQLVPHLGRLQRFEGLAVQLVDEIGVGFVLHCGLMFAARITLPHFSVSSVMTLPRSAGVPGNGVLPRSAKRAFSLGSARPALISMLSCRMISVDVPCGAPMPSHAIDS